MNGSVSPLDRVFASLAYLMPLSSAYIAGGYFLQFLATNAPPLSDALNIIMTPLIPFILLDNSIFGIAIFFGLFIFVVRNTNISRFIRYNVLQGLLVSILISISMLIIRMLGLGSIALIGESLMNVLFLGGMGIVVYGVFQSVRGEYAEIPTISEAINMQLPY